MLKDLIREIKFHENKIRAQHSIRFFKTQKGEYAYGDKFLGLTVPQQRTLAKKYRGLNLEDLQKLLDSPIHEHRLTALFILVDKFNKSPELQKEIFDFYLKNTKNINNWDLVDASAHKIVGEYIRDKDRSILYKLVKSNNLWEKRIAIISTFAFIKESDFTDAIQLSEILLNDEHHLIHKAVGWVLREVGKKEQKTLLGFLDKYKNTMPRTVLRYAIERFPEAQRKYYLYRD